MSAASDYEAAIAKVREAERYGRSQSTLNRLWRNVFAAEDLMRRGDRFSQPSGYCSKCRGPHVYKHGKS